MTINSNRSILAITFAVLIGFSAVACEPGGQVTGPQEPSITADPIGRTEGEWKVVASDRVSLTVTAPGAKSVKLLYRPVVAEGRHAVLKTLNEPAEPGSGRFSTELKAGPDFVGHVWAEITYPDGTKKETEPIALATEASFAAPGQIPVNHIGPTAGTDESARSDKITGGRIEQAALAEGQSRIWITVNVPAFRLTLWQDGKEVKTYQIGVGRKNFPIKVGERKATEIIWNPEWVPPDSPWVLEDEDVEPGERIEADDPRNPLGKLKIPLGEGYLIHQAAKPSDIGRLVSHGCIRMLKDDIFDLAEMIVAARNLPVTREQIERAKNSTERLAVKLDPPIWVDINYDTQVVEAGNLYLYPDVYDRGSNTVENLRQELQTNGVDVSTLDQQALKQMLDRVSMKEAFVVRLADITAGRAPVAGQNKPLTDNLIEKKPTRREATRR